MVIKYNPKTSLACDKFLNEKSHIFSRVGRDVLSKHLPLALNFSPPYKNMALADGFTTFLENQ